MSWHRVHRDEQVHRRDLRSKVLDGFVLARQIDDRVGDEGRIGRAKLFSSGTALEADEVHVTAEPLKRQEPLYPDRSMSVPRMTRVPLPHQTDDGSTVPGKLPSIPTDESRIGAQVRTDRRNRGERGAASPGKAHHRDRGIDRRR